MKRKEHLDSLGTANPLHEKDKELLRQNIQKQIDVAQQQYDQLEAVIAAATPVASFIPEATYLTKYQSNYHWHYYALAHKEGKLITPTNSKGVIKIHLGRPENPRYLEGNLALMDHRILKLQREALERVEEHLQALKALMALTYAKTLSKTSVRQLREFSQVHESVFAFIVRQHDAATPPDR